MGVIISMAVFSTKENGKDEYLRRTLQSLKDTVDLKEHKLILSVNGHTDETARIFSYFSLEINHIIWNGKNLGTAEAINQVWKERLPGQHAIKLDDDVVIKQSGWVELMLECIDRDPRIGIIGLRRKDLLENPTHADPYFRSELQVVPHKPGERNLIVEEVHHVMGTCVMHNSALLDKVGYLYQPSLYGYDDVLMAKRSRVAGFKNVFLPQIEIDHIDPGGGEFTTFKHKQLEGLDIKKTMTDYETGAKSIYYNPFE